MYATSVFSAASTWLIGRGLNHSKVTITKNNLKRTERRYEVNHSLYGIPFEFWAILWMVVLFWYAWNRFGHSF